MVPIVPTTPQDPGQPQRRYKGPNWRQWLLICVALSLLLHLFFGGGAVLPGKIAEWRAAKIAQQHTLDILAKKEQQKQARAAATQAVFKETRKEVQADLKDEFNTIVENQLKPDIADQLWQQILAKLTKDLDSYTQALADPNQTDPQVRAKMEQVQQQMLDEMLKHLKDMTTRELADKYVARVAGDVAPKVADYYKQQIDKRIGDPLKDEGGRIIGADSAAVHAQRLATNQALTKAETQVTNAQTELTAAQRHLDQQVKAAASAKTDAQKQAVQSSINKDQAAIDRAAQTIQDAQKTLDAAASSNLLSAHVKKSIAGASAHPAATQAIADANQAVSQSKQALAPTTRPSPGPSIGNTSAPGPSSTTKPALAAGGAGPSSGRISDPNTSAPGPSSTTKPALAAGGAGPSSGRNSDPNTSAPGPSSTTKPALAAGGAGPSSGRNPDRDSPAPAANLADAAKSAGDAAAAAGKFRDAIRQAKDTAAKDAYDNPDTSVAARLAAKHARDQEIKNQLDKAFENRVAAQALPRLSDKLTEAFKQTLAQAGIDDDAAVQDVSGKVRDVLAKKVPGAVDAGQAGTAALTKAQHLDQLAERHPDSAPGGNLDTNSKASTQKSGPGTARLSPDNNPTADSQEEPGGPPPANAADRHGPADPSGKVTAQGNKGDTDSTGKGPADDNSHEKSVADKMNQAAKDLTDHGMGDIAGDTSGDDKFTGIASGKKRAGGSGDGDADDGLVELTDRVGLLAQGAKHAKLLAGGEGAGDGDGAGRGAGAGGGAGGGAGNGPGEGAGDGGGGGSFSRFRRDAFERTLAANEAIRDDSTAFDTNRYAQLTAAIHERDPKSARGQVVARQGASGIADMDIAAMVAAYKDQFQPAAFVIPSAPKDSSQAPVGVPDKSEPYHPKFKNIRFAAIPYRTKPIDIDGDLSEWADVPALPMFAAGPGVNDMSLKHYPQEVKIQWDNTGFYIAYDVKDADNKITKVKANDFWQGDGIEFWVDSLNTKEKERTEVTHQFWAWVDGEAGNSQHIGGEALTYNKHAEFIPYGKEMIQCASKKTPLGWTIEVHIPVERFRKLDLEPGRILGMNFSICTGTTLYYYWAGSTEISTSTRPDTWGDVLLAGSDGKLECIDQLASELKQTQTAQPLNSLRIGQPLRIRVTDPVMNLSDRVKDKVSVEVAARHGGQHVVILEETTPTSGIFEGAIRTALEIGEVSPDILTLYEGEKIDVTYTDPCRADGSRDVPVRLTLPTASAVTGLAAK